MCRPDDFPPYPKAVLEMVGAMYRTLGPEEEQEFRSWARDHWTPGQPINPLWHPVIRDECRRMARPSGFPETCADCQSAPATVFLPEGRYLCKPCWDALRNLREAVVADSARRSRQRARAFASRKGKGR